MGEHEEGCWPAVRMLLWALVFFLMSVAWMWVQSR